MSCAIMLPMPHRVAPRELTVAEIATLTSDQGRNVQRRVAGWFSRQQLDPTLPRVRRAKLAWAERWSYLVDAASYDSFTSRERQSPLPPAFDTDEARAGGCQCKSWFADGERRAIVSGNCPVHRVLFASSAR
jgi:hypothetical protein